MPDNKIVQSQVETLKSVFGEKYSVDFYQREYVWQRKQLEDLMTDLSTEFLRNWSPSDSFEDVTKYDPYYMGEIVVSRTGGPKSAIIDGQQRISTLSLLLIYLLRKYGNMPKFPKSDIEKLIYSDYYGKMQFNLEIDERKECMESLYQTGEYQITDGDSVSVRNLVDRYNDIEDCLSDEINDNNIIHFVYWIMNNIVFSKVWTNSDEFAYVIFETMNDRGLSLTQVEMLRSYLLAKIDVPERNKAMERFDDVVKRLTSIKLSSKSKAEFEFFKVFLRGKYAKDSSQKNISSDFVRIGKEFHRWVRDNADKIGLIESKDYVSFLKEIDFYSRIYEKIYQLIQERNTADFLYLIVNSDYGFTLQPALILSSINENDTEQIIERKIQIVSKYLTKVLTWRIWNHWLIAQATMEDRIYDLCIKERGKTIEELEKLFAEDPIQIPDLNDSPTLNHQNKPKLKVLLSLITEIVASNSGTPDYMLNKSEQIDIEHIWSDHYDQHKDECATLDDFAAIRNNIGDLLVLPRSFNASYGDDPYSSKIVHYYSQNILAQSLNKNKYNNNPGFVKFVENSGLSFKPYNEFKRVSISERAELYKAILKWNWE